MNPWLIILIAAVLVTGAVLAFYMVLTQIVIMVSKRHVKKTLTAYTKKFEDLLPGANCGKCGYESCHAYAEALAYGREEDCSRCTEGGQELPEKLHAYIEELERMSAPAEKLEDLQEHAEL